MKRVFLRFLLVLAPITVVLASIALARPQPAGTLSGRRIYVSPGHGYYWNSSLGWTTQRGDSYGLIEDIHTNEIVIHYLQKYLWNAGANTFICREIGKQSREIIIDNEEGAPGYTEPTGTWTTTTSSGLGYNGGRYRYANISASETATARWTPSIPTAGYYGVWVWYYASSNRSTDALYRIIHSGGTTSVRINQQTLGARWVWLGEYYFNTGQSGYLELSNDTDAGNGSVVIADAARFGAGYGSISRGGSTSGQLRWRECSRYWLQYLGAPSSVYDYYSTGEDNSDDVVARPLYADWQGGDAYVSIHTNAGGGSGTVTYIHDTSPSPGSDQLAQRFQGQIVADIRTAWDSSWTDRGVRTANFGEVREVDSMPAALIEIAFHDLETPDNAYLHEDEFRRLVSRAIYKGVARYFGGDSVMLAPNPPTHFTARNVGNGTIRLSWRAPSPGPNESQATSGATNYKIYASTNGKGFDNGTNVGNVTSYDLTGLPQNQVYFFQVRALNSGGESFPTETLAARVNPSGNANILLVTGFDRLDRYVTERNNENTFDYVIQHGNAIAAIASRTYYFDSASNEAVRDGDVTLPNYTVLDWILGEESTADQTFDGTEQTLLQDYLNDGGALFVSGAEIGWDLDYRGSASDRLFFNTYLRADYVADDSGVYSVNGIAGTIFEGLSGISFDNGSYGTYDVDWPDCYSAYGGSTVNLTYSGTSYNAGIQYSGVYRIVHLGFPFETIYPSSSRTQVMQRVLEFLLPGGTATIETAPSSLSFAATLPASPASQTLTISNSGTGTMNWTAIASQSWLSILPGSGSLGAGASVDTTVSVSSGLAAGSYSETITVSSPDATNSPLIIPVSVSISPASIISLNPGTLSFSMELGGTPPSSQNIILSNTGTGTMSWTLSENAAWLGAAPASGSLAAPNSTNITVSVDPAGLTPGTYNAVIRVSSPDASNSPQTAVATFTLTTSGQYISVSPGTLAFKAEVGGSNPPSQTINIANAGTGTMSWDASDDAPWLTISPTAGTAPSEVTASVSIAGLSAQTYAATITISSAAASNSPETVPVTLNVTATPNAPSDLAASPTATPGIQLSWQDNSIAESGFRIERRTGRQGAWSTIQSVAAGQTAYEDTAVLPDTSYYYRVCAFNASGSSSYSDIALGIIPSPLVVENDVGRFTSIAIDAAGMPHISYYDVTNGDLRYTYRTGAGWSDSAVDAPDDVGRFTSLRLSSSGRPRISYYDATNGNLKFAAWNGTGWSLSTADNAPNDVGQYSSLVLDVLGNPHIAYYDATGGNLLYIEGILSADGSVAWNVPETADSVGDVGRFCSIALRPDSSPRISYYDAANGDLKYASRSDSSWTSSAIDQYGNVGRYTSLRMDSYGFPHIIYQYYDAANAIGDLKYARWTGTAWDIRNLDYTDDGEAARVVGEYASLSLDGYDNPMVVYYDATAADLRLMWSPNGGSDWYSTILDAPGDVGRYCSIEQGHVSYYDGTGGDLKYLFADLVREEPAQPTSRRGGGGGLCLLETEQTFNLAFIALFLFLVSLASRATGRRVPHE